MVDKITDEMNILIGSGYIKIVDPPPFGNYHPKYIVIAWPREGNQVGLFVRKEP